MESFIRRLFADPEMLRMGHHQREADLNLGLGWLYYALGRVIRPRHAVVIGSWRGFVPAVIGKALIDNGADPAATEIGRVTFVDPSLADPFWTDASAVAAHFAGLGAPNVEHHHHTTQSFVATAAYAALDQVGLLMIDGFHTAEQALFDYLAFVDKLSPDACVLVHDSLRERESTFYGDDRPYRHTVTRFVERLAATRGLEVLTLPFGAGLTLVRGRPADDAERAALAAAFAAPFAAP
ncbi:MAG: class I SAM-dependent methyltransferase [Myxococcota bacterium]